MFTNSDCERSDDSGGAAKRREQWPRLQLCESCGGRLRCGESGRVGARGGSSSCFLRGRCWCTARCRCCCSRASGGCCATIRCGRCSRLFRVCMNEVLRIEPSDRDEEIENFGGFVHVDFDQLLRLILLQETTSETLGGRERQTTTNKEGVSNGDEPWRPTEGACSSLFAAPLLISGSRWQFLFVSVVCFV